MEKERDNNEDTKSDKLKQKEDRKKIRERERIGREKWNAIERRRDKCL